MKLGISQNNTDVPRFLASTKRGMPQVRLVTRFCNFALISRICVFVACFAADGVNAAGDHESIDLPGAPPNHQINAELKGSLVLALFQNGSCTSNNYSFDLEIQAPCWHLTLKSADPEEETFVDSNQVVWIVRFDPAKLPKPDFAKWRAQIDASQAPEAVKQAELRDVAKAQHLTNIAVNVASMKVIPGTRPLTLRLAEHVWAAFFSGDAFRGKKPPFLDLGLSIEGPCVFTELQSDAQDASPHIAKWHNAKLLWNKVENDGEFRWLSSTNWNGVRIPLRSDLTASSVYPNGTVIPANYSQLTIDSISKFEGLLPKLPDVKGEVAVIDYRTDMLADRLYIQYVAPSAAVLDTNSPVFKTALDRTWHMIYMNRRARGDANIE